MTKKPSYRFAGYTEVWEQKKLGEVSEKVREKNSDNLYSSVLTNSAEFGIIPQRDFFDKDIANEKNLNGYYIVKHNDFVYNPRISNHAPVGPIKPNKLNEVGVMSPLYYVFRTHDIENSYLATYFDATYWHKFMKINGDSGARADRFAIKDSVFVEMPIPIPSLPEQTAIGSFFQDIDQFISLQQRKLEVLKEQKKTYLKLLFPAKGQNKPALRFAGFEDEWKEVKLGEVAELKRGLTYKPTSVVENGIRVLRSSNIDGDVFKKQEDDVFVEDSSVTIPYVQFGDILITAANGSSKLVGKHAIIEDSEKMVHGGFMLLARSKQYKFLNALLSSEWYSRFINVSVAGGNGAIGNLSKSNLEKEIVLCPTIPEQEAIGSFFQDLDKAIAKQDEKVNQLKESKQTLLRKMFI